MKYLPRWSASVWALLVLLTGSAVVCLSPAWSADQKPLVINPTTGKTEQLQPTNNLYTPDGSLVKVLNDTVSTSALDGTLIIGDGLDGITNIGMGEGVINLGTSINVLPGADANASASFGSTSTGTPTALRNSSVTIKAPSSAGFSGAAQLFLDSGESRISYAQEGVAQWWFYRLRGDSNFYFRDMVNARMHITMSSGATVTAANTALNSALTVASTTDSISKDTGSIVTEGGIGAEKNITAGGGVYGVSLVQAGTGAVASSVNIIADGGNSGTATGSSNLIRNAGATILGFGNYSAMLGGAYDARPTVYSAAPVLFIDDVNIGTAGKGLLIKEGSNAKMGAATLVGGTVTVNTTAVTANSRIYLTSQVDGGTPGYLRVSARVAATSFTITSGSGTDTSTVAWMIVEPAP